MRTPAHPAWLAMARSGWHADDPDVLRGQLEAMGSLVSIQEQLHAQGRVRDVARLLVERAGEVQAADRVIVALRQHREDTTFEIFDSEAGEAPHDAALLTDDGFEA